jgi:hypothetical protein
MALPTASVAGIDSVLTLTLPSGSPRPSPAIALTPRKARARAFSGAGPDSRAVFVTEALWKRPPRCALP